MPLPIANDVSGSTGAILPIANGPNEANFGDVDSAPGSRNPRQGLTAATQASMCSVVIAPLTGRRLWPAS